MYCGKFGKKKEDTYPKRVIDTHRLGKITDRIQKSATDYIFTNTNINDKDYQWTTRLQSLLRDYRRLQNIGQTTKFSNRLQKTKKHWTDYKVY